MLCTCGKVPDFYLLPYVNRVATADPMPVHVRQRVKSLKALLGPTAAVDYDFVETTLDGFASAVGTGAALYLKFTVPLEPADMARYRKWLAIAREHDLCRGEYLNLYDLAHDFPEAHVVRKGDRLYYGFYASPWAGDNETPYQGQAELRGLAPGKHYKIVDYVSEREMGVVTGPAAALEVSFRGSLLLFAEPAVAFG
jgi:alpha-galactosidase